MDKKLLKVFVGFLAIFLLLFGCEDKLDRVTMIKTLEPDSLTFRSAYLRGEFVDVSDYVSGYGFTISGDTSLHFYISGKPKQGVFGMKIEPLTANKTYHYYAYASEPSGSISGESISFPIEPDRPGEIITDANGNTYNTVWIGGRQWMKENLKTTKYRNGTNIPHVTDNGAWEGLSTPAYCWYNNDIANKPTYGALYNWYTVNTGNLCPTGWHVPTDVEWTTLTNYAGGASTAGTKLKATSGWNNNGNGTDHFGFSALPGGYRIDNGTFLSVGYFGLWLSSKQRNASSAYFWYMYYISGSVIPSIYSKRFGFSVRCVRDN
jgi:uncharacterized protein (TIGR02145 family)